MDLRKYFNQVKSYFPKTNAYFTKNKVYRYLNYLLVGVSLVFLGWLHVQVFSETKQEGDVLRASTFSGMSPICLQSEKASVQNSVVSTGGERLTGFEVLLLKKIAEEMGKSLDLRLNTFAGLVGDIEYKNSDVAAACFSITLERRDKIDFSVVYNVPMNALIVRKDNPDFLEFEAGSKVQDKDLFAHLEKLADKAAKEGKTKKFNFIAMATSTTDKELFKKGNMKAQLSPKYRDDLINYATGSDNAAPNLQAVRENKEQGKEVIYVIDDVIARGNVEGDKDLKYISLQTDNPLLLSSPEGIGIAVHKGDKEMLKAVNNALVKIFDLDVKKKEVEKEEDNGTKTFKVEDKIYDLKKILETLRKLKLRLAPQRTNDQENRYKDLKGKNTRKPEEEKEFEVLFKVWSWFSLNNTLQKDTAKQRLQNLPNELKQLEKVVYTLTECLKGSKERQIFKNNYDELKVKKSYKFSSTSEEKIKNQERTLDEEQQYQFLKKYLFAFFDETKEAKTRRVLNAKKQELEASQKEKETLGKCLDENDKGKLEEVQKRYEELNTKNKRNAAEEQEFVELNKTTRAQTATENDSSDVQKYEYLTSKKEAIKNKIDEILKVVFDETVYNEKGFLQKGDDSLWGKIKYHLPTYTKPFYTSLLLTVDGVVFGFLLSLVLLAVKNKSTLSRTNNVFVKGVKQVGSKFVDFYVWLLNGVPIAAQGLLVWFARHLWWPSIFPTMHQTHAALVVIVLNSAANIAVVLMQTLKFVDKGQVEAAQSLGLNKKQTFYYVTFPQALKKSVPLVAAQFVTNIKACTFFGLIALIDMSFVTNDAMNVTGDLVAPFVILSVVYLVLIQFINMLSKYLEKKLNPALKTVVSA